MSRAMTWLAVIFLSVAACGCHSSSATTVDHVVFFWLKTAGDEAQRQRIIDEADKFRQIPGVISVATGRAVPSTRPIVDSSFDIGVVITFRDEESMKAYNDHPIHKKAATEVLRPIAARIQVYDIKRGQPMPAPK